MCRDLSGRQSDRSLDVFEDVWGLQFGDKVEYLFGMGRIVIVTRSPE